MSGTESNQAGLAIGLGRSDVSSDLGTAGAVSVGIVETSSLRDTGWTLDGSAEALWLRRLGAIKFVKLVLFSIVPARI